MWEGMTGAPDGRRGTVHFSDAGERKRRMRAEMSARREMLPEAYLRDAEARMRQRLFQLSVWEAAESLFAYVSTEREPDTRLALRQALAEGKRVYVPKCMGQGRMLAARIRSLEELVPGMFGIPEPERWTETRGPEGLDLILVPCLCASTDGKRLGHGGGYYDRFLADHAEKSVCLCWQRMLREDIPLEKTDVKAAAVLTEDDLWIC